MAEQKEQKRNIKLKNYVIFWKTSINIPPYIK